MGQPLAAAKSLLLKKINSTAVGVEEKTNGQEQVRRDLDEVVKAVEQKRRYVKHLEQEINKNKSSNSDAKQRGG